VLLSSLLDPGETYTIGFVFDASQMLQGAMKDRERMGENGIAEKVARVSAVLYMVL
jgi:hypothetical protein